MSGVRAHLPVYQLRGPKATQQMQGEAAGPPECSAAPGIQPWEEWQKTQGPNTKVTDKDGGTKESGRGLLTQTPRSTVLTTRGKGRKPRRPCPGRPPSSLLPSWPQAQFWVGERPRG